MHTTYKNNIALAKASVDEDVRSWLQGKTVSYIVQPSLYIDIRPQNATTGQSESSIPQSLVIQEYRLHKQFLSLVLCVCLNDPAAVRSRTCHPASDL